MVKEEDDLELPTNVLCIEHVELIVTRNNSREEHAQEKNSAKLKNMKRFRKVIFQYFDTIWQESMIF